MNANHALCGSREWAAYLQTNVLPAVMAGLALGDDMLELGPGPGAATDWLRRRVRRLVAVECDPRAVDALTERYGGTNVDVLCGDATALDLDAGAFDSVATFTMLHHVPTLPLQARLLSEALRVLRPGGVLVGADSLHSDALHQFHDGDTYNPIDPATLLTVLLALGYERITITVDDRLTFVAHKPDAEPTDRC